MAGEDLQELSAEDASILGLEPLSDGDATQRGFERLAPETPEPRALSPEMAQERGLMPLDEDMARERGLEPLPQAESAPDTFWREARNAVIPSLAALPAAGAGAKAGAIAGALGGPYAWATVPAGAVAGGVAGALGGAALMSSIQEWALKKLGLSDAEQRQVNEQENPGSSFAGGLAPGVVAFNPGKLTMKISERLLGGGLQGGIEAGQELVNEGHVDPYKVAAATAFGGVFANPNKLGKKLINAGESRMPGEYPEVAPRFPAGRPDQQARPGAEVEKQEAGFSNPPKVDTGTATQATPPPKEAPTVGNPDSAAVRSSREYPKEQRTGETTLLHMDENVPVDPTVRAALDAADPTLEVARAARQAEQQAPTRVQRQFEGQDFEPTARTDFPLEPDRPASPQRKPVEDPRLGLDPQEYPHAAGQFPPAEQAPAGRARVTPPQRLNPQEYPQAAPKAQREAGKTIEAVKPAEAPVKPVDTGLAEASTARSGELLTATVSDRAMLTRPKVVEEAIRVLQERKPEGHERIVEALGKADPHEAMQVSRAYLADVAREARGQGPAVQRTTDYANARIPAKVAKVEELGVTARDKADAARKSGAIKALRKAFDDNPPAHARVPTSKDDLAELRTRLEKATKDGIANYDGKDPLSYRPRVRPAEWLWMRAAKKLLASSMRPKAVREFIAAETQLRSGIAEDVAMVRGTNRIEGDIARSRRSGEDAIADAENTAANLRTDETVLLSGDEAPSLADQVAAAREENTKLKAGELPGSDIVSAEDAPGGVVEPIRSRAPELMTDAELDAAAKEQKGPSWKELEEKRAQGSDANLARLRELRASGAKTPSTHEVLLSFISDESGAGGMPAFIRNMFGPPSTAAVATQGRTLMKQVPAAKTLPLWGTNTIVQYTDALYGGRARNPFRPYEDALNRAGVKATDLNEAAGPMVDSIAQSMDKYRGPRWNEFTDLMYDETRYQIWADRPATSKAQGFRISEWARAKHPDLETRFNALPQDLKDLRMEWHDFAQMRQKALTQQLGENKMASAMGIKDPQLVKRIIDQTETPQDIALLGQDSIDMIRKHAERSILDGPYLPQNRWGDYVVNGKYDIPTPANALRQLKPNSWEFNAKADVDAFVHQLELAPSVRGYYVDANGNQTYTANGKEMRYVAGDPNTHQRWEVKVEDNHVEFADTYRDALAREAELRTSGALKAGSTDVQAKRFRPKTDAVALAENLGMNSLRGNKHFNNLPASQQKLVRQAIAEEYLNSMASSRGGSSRVHRSNVAGYDTNFLRAASSYAQESGHRLAQLEFRPQMDEALAKAKESTVTGSPTADTTFSNARVRVYNEIAKRDTSIQNDDYNLHATITGRALHRLLTVSQAARLATPGYSIRNATQPVLLGAPALHGHFGNEGVAELGRVYKQIGTMKTFGTGLKETVRAAKGGDKPAPILDDIKATLPDAFSREAVDYLRAIGAVDGDAGFMVHKYAGSPDGVKLDLGLRQSNRVVEAAESVLTKADRALEWLDDVTRQLPRAVEAVNRVTVGVAAARQEFRRNGGNKDAAFQFAKDIVDQTNFRYSDTNKAPWQKAHIARLPMQFKEYGKGTYALIGQNIGKVIKNQSPGDRAAGLTTLAGMAVATTAFAGILGLPTEPFRMLLLGAKMAGFTDKEWDDVELKVREMTAAVAGKSVGEALAKGLPRLLNIDLSTGLGMDNLLFFGSPRAGSDRDFDNNLQSWLGQMLIGAPGTTILQAHRGLRSLSNGEYMKAAQDLIPFKMGSDIVRAARQTTEGTKSPSGRELSKPYSPTEAASRVMGLPPGREAEENFHRRINTAHDFSERDRRGKLINAWLTATSQESKQRAFTEAVRGGVNGRDLADAYRRRNSQERREVGATVPTRRNKPFAEHTRGVLNIPDEPRQRTQREPLP